MSYSKFDEECRSLGLNVVPVSSEWWLPGGETNQVIEKQTIAGNDWYPEFSFWKANGIYRLQQIYGCVGPTLPIHAILDRNENRSWLKEASDKNTVIASIIAQKYGQPAHKNGTTNYL
jgi:hypothetical protein